LLAHSHQLRCVADTPVGSIRSEFFPSGQGQGACRCFKPITSSQAERNILLCLPSVNMLWPSFFSML
jgi:hypothetical protein